MKTSFRWRSSHPTRYKGVQRGGIGVGEFVRRWVQAGGKIMGGTDDPFPGATGFNQHMEMAMLVEVGLTPMQALKAMTIWGAEVMTARRKTPTTPPVGFIGPGAFADIVVLGANPLDDIENTRKIDRVMKGGKFVRLGYTADYTKPQGPLRAIPSTPEPEISAITPNAVAEGGSDFEMTVEGVGFIRRFGRARRRRVGATTFADIRTLKAIIPQSRGAPLPNRFNEPGRFSSTASTVIAREDHRFNRPRMVEPQQRVVARPGEMAPQLIGDDRAAAD